MLSKEQQQTIENSIWVVNTVLKRQGLQGDKDLRQTAILYMCKCLERFDPNKDIKWTTYAYKSVFLFVRRTYLKEKKRLTMIVEADVCDIDKSIKHPTNADDNNLLADIRAVCTPEENNVLDLKLKGYKVAEISALMNCSTSKVNACMQSIKGKAKEIEF